VIDEEDTDAAGIGHAGEDGVKWGCGSRFVGKMACARTGCGRRRRWILFFWIYPCPVRASGQCPSTLSKATGT
jgi:hypothetical protein